MLSERFLTDDARQEIEKMWKIIVEKILHAYYLHDQNTGVTSILCWR